MTPYTDLFGNVVLLVDLVKPRKSAQVYKMLIQLYGESAGNKCGKCKFFFWRCRSKKYPKCAKSGCDGHTVNHDWSSRWSACGLFELDKVQQ